MKKGVKNNFNNIVKYYYYCNNCISYVRSNFYNIDKERAQNVEEPLFCKSQDWTYMDGGTKEYWGLGYKVIKFNRMGGYNKVKN